MKRLEMAQYILEEFFHDTRKAVNVIPSTLMTYILLDDKSHVIVTGKLAVDLALAPEE